MDVIVTCFKCVNEQGEPSVHFVKSPFFEDFTTEFKCEFGHTVKYIIGNPRFEVLLDSGALALKRGYTIEAVMSYSTALERFFEFASKVMLRFLGMDQETYNLFYKGFSRYSERQLGMFFVLHALVLGSVYSLDKKIVEYRNKVVHGGSIPTPLQAKMHCLSIYEQIFDISKLLHQKCKIEIEQEIEAELLARKGASDDEVFSVTNNSIFSILQVDENINTFDESYESYINFLNSIGID